MRDQLNPVTGIVEHLFRHESGRIVAVLTRRLGVKHIDLVEDVVQDALIAAIDHWPLSGVPSNPPAWLMRVARNRATDRLRRESSLRDKLDTSPLASPRAGVCSEADLDDEAIDDQLAMVLLCCHPSLRRESQVALTLKSVSGFSVAEIARALLTRKATIAQRIVRAKHTLLDQGIELELPAPDALADRLATACEVLYLLFNEGYGAHGGENLTRSDLCQEALRLAELLAAGCSNGAPEVEALLALMCMQMSRLAARTADDGSLVLLRDQDRSRWNRRLIEDGLRHLESASVGPHASTYHLESGIAACHATAGSSEATDWRRILFLYDELLKMSPSPIVALNRAVAVSNVHGPEAALAALREVENDKRLDGYYLLPAIEGDLWAQLERPDEALRCFRTALLLPCTTPEQRFLTRRIRDLEGVD